VALLALLIEDDEAFRSLARPVLAARGFTVLEASTLAEAQALLEGPRPALLVVDGQLPDGTGDALLRSLPSALGAVPALFVSASWRGLAAHRTLRQGLGARPLVIVHKPVPPEVLASQLEQLLTRASTPPLPPEVAEAMEQLRREYQEGLPRRLAELRALVQGAADAPWDAQACAAARTAAHRLAGTAGSYGFPDESAAAAAVEALAIRAERSPEAARAEAWTEASSTLEDALLVP
jgi:DNA-binding response OmpR family regulator